MQSGHRGGNIIINNGPAAAGGHIMQGVGVGGMGMGVGFLAYPDTFGSFEDLQESPLQSIGGDYFIVYLAQR